MYTDKELVALIKEGNRDAFTQLYNNYSSKLLNHIFKMVGNKEEAEEILADVFILIIKKISFFSESEAPGVGFKSWIFRIASNLSIDYLRRRKKEKQMKNNQNSQENIADIEVSFCQNEELEDVNRLMDKLPAMQRTVMSLKVIENFSYMEISRVTGVSIAMVKQLLFQARHRLRQDFRQEERCL